MLTPKELEEKFNIAFMQYESIDRNKCERFGKLVQGFFGVKKGDNCKVVPFYFSNSQNLKEVIETLKKFKTDYLGISFVQHYIHYT